MQTTIIYCTFGRNKRAKYPAKLFSLTYRTHQDEGKEILSARVHLKLHNLHTLPRPKPGSSPYTILGKWGGESKLRCPTQAWWGAFKKWRCAAAQGNTCKDSPGRQKKDGRSLETALLPRAFIAQHSKELTWPALAVASSTQLLFYNATVRR